MATFFVLVVGVILIIKYQMTWQEIVDQTQVQVAVILKCDRKMNWQSEGKKVLPPLLFLKFDIVHLINVVLVFNSMLGYYLGLLSIRL